MDSGEYSSYPLSFYHKDYDMQVTEKDLEIIKKTFETINKAKWDGLDGNGIISVYQSFVSLRALEDKLSKAYKEQQIAQQPKPEKIEVTSEPKKSKKKVE